MQRYDPDALRALLERVAGGAVGADEALAALRELPFAAIKDALVDHHRGLRTGVPEVVYGEGKTREQIAAVMSSLHDRAGFALATRVAPVDGRALAADLPDATYAERARVLRCGALPRTGLRVAVVCAGTSDLPVADEAAATLDAFGHDVARCADVGVAGMEGALPSVVAGLVDVPVVAVPTSVGYGASFGGLAALLAMLNACAPGVATVNIDGGFAAACVAHKILVAAR